MTVTTAQAVAWRDAVYDALVASTDRHGGDPDTLVAHHRFIERLDPVVALDPDDPTLGAYVECAAVDTVTELHAPRIAESMTEPYGDVMYADPGYRADGVKRYPLDTEEHCRAAWSYIHQADNAGKYDAEDLARIRARIAVALKRHGVQVSESTEPAEDEGAMNDGPATEAVAAREPGRVVEARGVNEAGGRVFGVRIIRYGDSRNLRRYPPQVLREAVGRYEGAKAYDHHRTDEELRTSTLTGLIGSYRNVEARADGLYGDLHLLPSATHAAEALDATLAAQREGRPPLVGISHDVRAHFRSVVAGGQRLQEATKIVDVQSADVVANPSAGGVAVRAVAGGIDPREETDVPVTTESVLAVLKTATPEQLSAVGLQHVPAPATESTAEPGAPQRAVESGQPDRVIEAGHPKASFLARLMVRQKVADAGLPEAVAESIVEALPDRITESDVDAQVAALKTAMGLAERTGLVPTVTAQVTRESADKKAERLDGFFAGDFVTGYRSLRHAYMDITGYRPSFDYDEDVNRRILRESFGGGYDSAVRAEESVTTATWAQVLGDSVTRRVVAAYRTPSLQTWRRVVSSVVPIDDFRTQRVGRVGGYGVLPTVNEGQPYQPLTSSPDEEATYALAKKGGTEDVTLEQIANDDRRVIPTIPTKLGRAAAQTLYRFVFDFFANNSTATYDSVAWFHASHSNTTAAALSQSALSTASVALMTATAYGDSYEVLGEPAKLLIVPAALRELAYQLTTSAVAVPSTAAGPSDTPNIHSQLDRIEPIVVPYWSDANDWFAMADPAAVPTLEVGFYQGRQEPEIFTQADQNVGSVFNSDTFTWKVRIIFSGTILDHRGVQRGTQ